MARQERFCFYTDAAIGDAIRASATRDGRSTSDWLHRYLTAALAGESAAAPAGRAETNSHAVSVDPGRREVTPISKAQQAGRKERT